MALLKEGSDRLHGIESQIGGRMAKEGEQAMKVFQQSYETESKRVSSLHEIVNAYITVKSRAALRRAKYTPILAI